MLVANQEPPFDVKVFLSTLSAGKTNLEFRANTEIYAQGSPADAVFFLLKGMVKVATVTPAGKEAVLSILGPNNFLGDGCLTNLTQRRVTVTAIDETSVIRLEAGAMKRALRDEPRFSEHYIAYLVERKIRTEFSLVDQLVNSSEKRLARALLQLTEVGAGEEPRSTGVKISQDTLADMVGTTRSRVSFFMNKFRRLGFIEYKDKLRVNGSLLRLVLNDGQNGGDGGTRPQKTQKRQAR